MKTDEITDINSAIGRSISHNEIVRVTVADQSEALGYLDESGRITELDSARENNGDLDVWGKRQGEDFRIKLVKE